MGTGKLGNLTRPPGTGRRTAILTVLGAAIVVGALLFPISALANHDAADYFIFARAEHGDSRKSNETNCDGSNDKQAEVSGSTNIVDGRIHSNADIAISGSGNTFADELTYGTADEDCQVQAEATNTYSSGPPDEIDSDPPGVTNQWPGNLSTFLNPDTLTFGNDINQVLPGETCDVGSLTNTTDIVLTAANDGDVVCNGTGKTSLAISGVTMSITIVSHGLIEVSGQNSTLRSASHGVLTWTDHQLDVSTKLAGSNLTVPNSAILFAPRGGINTSGSDDSELCIQLIGQGPINVAGSTSKFGPGSPACTETQPQPGTITIVKDADPNGPTDFTFTANIPGCTVGPLDDDADPTRSNTVVCTNVAAGGYTVTEDAPTGGYTLTAIVCSDTDSTENVGTRTAGIQLTASENVTCTFTNTQQPAPGTITIVKDAVPNGPTDFTFADNIPGCTVGPLDDDGDAGNTLSNQVVCPNVPAGDYTVTEDAPSGNYSLTGLSCSDADSTENVGTRTAGIKLAPGENLICTFTNTLGPPSVIDVDKTANPTSVTEPGGSVVFTVVVTNTSETLDVTLTAAGFTDAVGGGPAVVIADIDCNGATAGNGLPLTLQESNAGSTDQVTCTFTKTVSGNAGQSVTDVVEVTGTDSQGNPVKDDDPATVTITDVPSSILVDKTANPTSVTAPGGSVVFTVVVTNTSAADDVTLTAAGFTDAVGGGPAVVIADIDCNGGTAGNGLPLVLQESNAGNTDQVTCTFTKTVSGNAGQSVTDVVEVTGTDDDGIPVKDDDPATVTIAEPPTTPTTPTTPGTPAAPPVIDLVIVKDANPTTVALNATFTYTMTVSNKGPNTATNVQVADAPPAGVVLISATTSKAGATCNVGPSSLTCSLGDLTAGASVTITVNARATAVGTHTNTATVTGSGGTEANPADNTDTATITVPAPFVPPTRPTPKPKPKPQDICITLTVNPKMIKADGKPDRVSVKVTAGKKRVKGTKVAVFGAGVRKTARSNSNGMAFLRINPKRAGLITITAIETNQKVCGPKRIGVVGVFLPPLTG